MVLLDDRAPFVFPPVEKADIHGLLAIGGDLRIERLQLAYRSGIFPWYNPGEPILWYSPDPRMVLFPNEIRISKSMRSLLKKSNWKCTWNKDFRGVIKACKTVGRKDQPGTWITDDMEKAYIDLHETGMAKSIEVWEGNDLIGGLYGVDLGHVFCGESMFSYRSNASKWALIQLAKHLESQGTELIDCQVYNDHLASMGAREISRKVFMGILNPSKSES